MPSLNEGTLLYMPTTLPGISMTKAAELLQTQDPSSRPSLRLPPFMARRAARRPDGPGSHRDVRNIINLKPKENGGQA